MGILTRKNKDGNDICDYCDKEVPEEGVEDFELCKECFLLEKVLAQTDHIDFSCDIEILMNSRNAEKNNSSIKDYIELRDAMLKHPSAKEALTPPIQKLKKKYLGSDK